MSASLGECRATVAEGAAQRARWPRALAAASLVAVATIVAAAIAADRAGASAETVVPLTGAPLAQAPAVRLCGMESAGMACPACGMPGTAAGWACACQWECARSARWAAFAQGEYVGHARTVHVPEYRLRVDDQLDLVFRVTREQQSEPYTLNVGDEIKVESFTDAQLDRQLAVLPDGTITLRLLGQVPASGLTVTQLRDRLEEQYQEYYKVPAITVTPLKVNSRLEDLRATVDRRYGTGGQSSVVRITPEGTISLPALGTVPAQGLTLRELQMEINERYRTLIPGIEVVPALIQRAPRYLYVLGEVYSPGRFELVGPTTLIQALTLAGSWRPGANLNQVVVFRRDDNWQLMAAMVDIRPALRGNTPCPDGEIWLNDSDVVIVPKCSIQRWNDFIEMVFTKGVYGVFPLSSTLVINGVQ